MKVAFAATLLTGLDAATLRTPEITAHKSWAAASGKKYATKEEALYRAGIFAATKALQDEHNARYAAGEETWFMSLNPFSDLTHAEFRAAYTGGKRTSAGRLPAPPAPESAAANPTSVDWRTKGAVTPVKDQGQCGSCWAFATTVATEGSTYLGSNSTKLISLSEEQILACDTKDGNAACNGGDQLPAMQWLMTVPGQCSEADYPYSSGGGNSPKTCKTTCAPAAVITAAFEVPKEDQTALETAIAGRPISLSVDASSNAWQNYGGGVYTGSCVCKKDSCLDHGVGGVGYGTDQKAGDYWIVKNSWSAQWGEKGYILLGRGPKYGTTGQCGVQIDNQYTVSHPA